MADKILFGVPEDNNPDLTRKLAHGTETEEARSMTFAGLITWLTSRLPFFNTANNLSEANATAVRANLSVNSVAENTAALALKADKANVIEKNSTAPYTPTLATHPVNVAYGKMKYGEIVVAGIVQETNGILTSNTIKGLSFTVEKGGDGSYRVTHNYGAPNYVIATTLLGLRPNVFATAFALSNNGFDFRTFGFNDIGAALITHEGGIVFEVKAL